MSTSDESGGRHDFLNAIVRAFLGSQLSLVLIVVATGLGIAAVIATPREEDPQIVVPLADVFVSFPGRTAEEVEKLVATPLEKLLYQIDGVEHVYSTSRDDEAVITVRFFVGEDRERSLVKIYKRIDEHLDLVPPGVAGWLVKPVEIDDVPIVTLTLRGGGEDSYKLRRVAEEAVSRLATIRDVSRAYVVGGQSRVAYVYLDPERLAAHQLSPLAVWGALQAANVTRTAGEISRDDVVRRVEAGGVLRRAEELPGVVVGVSGDRPVLLGDVAEVRDGAEEASNYVRHGWGPARGAVSGQGITGTLVGGPAAGAAPGATEGSVSRAAVTIAVAKKRGTNSVGVAEQVIGAMQELRRDVLPDDVETVITRNYGQTADEKVNELIEALGVAVLIVIALLTIGLGWREALVVAVAVPVVFGLTLAVNLMLGYTINRVTLFALILSLGLLVDDPIVDVENIARHFHLRRRATREIVLEAVAEIRPPLIVATLAVVVSFLPMFFITGMMGPYMRPMALNVPVAMLMSMVVAFTITPWMTYHVLRRRDARTEGQRDGGGEGSRGQGVEGGLEELKRSRLYRLFHPLMAPLLTSRRRAWQFLGMMAILTAGAAGLGACRAVPLKMLPFDNKNELLLVLDFDEGTTLERADACVRELEHYVAGVPEVTDFTSYVGVASPIDFNGLVRHYYLRRGANVAELRVNLAGKKSRRLQSHAIGLRMRDDVTAIARRRGCNLKIVETPPGPPVISTLVAEVRGRADQTYAELIEMARVVRARLEREPGVVDVDDVVESAVERLTFVTDQEKAALNGVTVEEIAETVRLAVSGSTAGVLRDEAERNPLRIELRLPRALRSSIADLGRVHVQPTERRSADGSVAARRGERATEGGAAGLVSLAELGRWEQSRVAQAIYHKDLERVVYVFGETAGRAPAECVVDIESDRLRELRRSVGAPEAARVPAEPFTLNGVARFEPAGSGYISTGEAREVGKRTFLWNGGRVFWWVPAGVGVELAGEGEWQITLDVFRDLGLAFAAALACIYVLLVGQTGSFVIPLIVMLAIPLTVLGIMPGFWLLNAVAGGQVGDYADPVFFTATGMIGMIALAGIVTRDAIILVDFIHLSLARGRSLFDAIMESRVVRLRPILLTAGAAMLSALPIAIDPIFSGLAWALIFGLLASTVFTLFVIPVAYWLVYEGRGEGTKGRRD
ncbi:MAG: Multidrug resistance protein MdtC [Phycisphaerae bacterium]|nr:Multidrug resistance protein MdtC [Phycisphaerae bacterium]